MNYDEATTLISNSSIRGKSAEYQNGFIAMRDRAMKLLNEVNEPQKVKVTKEFDEWYQQIEQRWGKNAKEFALWKLGQFGFGNGFEDVNNNRTSDILSDWVCWNKEVAINAVWNGYDVEEEPKYRVNIGGLYLREPLGDTNDFTIRMTWNEDYAYPFDSWNMAREHITELGGTIEKV